MALKKISNVFSDLVEKTSFSVDSHGLTHTGLVRSNNEDSFLDAPKDSLWAVADGMGGHHGGEIASAIAIMSLKKGIVEGKSLESAILYTNDQIRVAEQEGIGKKGMGSTIVSLQINQSHYKVSWVGDSRAYLYRSHGLQCLSKDHSLVQQMLDNNLISEEEAEHHPYKHAITQALGGSDRTINVDTVKGRLHDNDIFLLCSDGLSGEVPLKTMEQILNVQNESLTAKAQTLLAQALGAGGNDNISLILVKISAI